MPQSLLNHLLYLHHLGAGEVLHKNGSLLQHLQGTWSLLQDWGNPEDVCLAGLYHSVYGTGGFEGQLLPLSQRPALRESIGQEAEELVYLFAACDRPITHPRIGKQAPQLFRDRFTGEDLTLESGQWQAQCEIMLANEVDLGLHNPAFYRKHLGHYRDLFARFTPWLSAATVAAHNQLARVVSDPAER